MPGTLVKFDAAAKQRCCAELARSGAPTHAARAAGVSFACMRNHYRGDPDFAAAYDRAMQEHRDMLYREAVRRGVDGYFDGARWKKSDTILLRLLQRHDPGFRDRVEIDQRTQVQVQHGPRVANLSDDELANLEQLLAKASP